MLNGAPRSGKSSIAAAIQEGFEGVWMNLGVDAMMAATPAQFQPGLGLRPGGERPDLEPLVVAQYTALYAAVAGFSCSGLNVVVDVGHHDDYSQPLAILPSCAYRLRGLPAWLIGVSCPVETNLERRAATGYPTDPEKVLRWEQVVHTSGIYDLQVDTFLLTPRECAQAIWRRMQSEPEAFSKLAALV